MANVCQKADSSPTAPTPLDPGAAADRPPGLPSGLVGSNKRCLTRRVSGVVGWAIGRAQLCGIRTQLNGPNDVDVVGWEAPGVTVSLSHSSGNVLPCTTTRWKFGTE
jgi:hypothetical protein